MDPVEFLKKTVEIKSQSGQEEKVSSYLVDVMQKLGYDAHRDEVGNAVGRKGEGSTTILLLGHIDTVGGHVPVKILDNKLFGRGTVDAKGSFCTFVMAASQAALNDVTLIVVGAVEEESPTSKGARYILDKYDPDYIIIGEPSGHDAVTLGYKGRLMVDYHREQEMSHTSSKDYGIIEKAFMFYSSLRNSVEVFNGDKFGIFKELQLKIQDIQSGSDGLKEWVDMTLGYRIPPDYNINGLKKYIVSVSNEAEIKIYGEEHPVLSNKNNDLVRAFLKAIRTHNLKPRFKIKTGTSDMNIMAAAFPEIPILAYGPGDSSLDHTPQEHIDIDEYRQSINILSHVLENVG